MSSKLNLSLLALASLISLACSTTACSSEDESDDASNQSEAIRSGGYVVNGHVLNESEGRWLEHVAKEVVPHLPGTSDEQLTTAARGFWWTLKEGNLEKGNWGKASNPIGYSLCNTPSGDRSLGPLDVCDKDSLERSATLYGRAWQVGIAGVQVPGRSIAKVETLAQRLYGGADTKIDALLEQTASLAGYPSGSKESRAIVESKGALRLSWLLRIPAVGFVEVVTKEVVPECIEGSKSYCYGGGWDETRKFASSKSAALRAIADIKSILSSKTAATGTDTTPTNPPSEGDRESSAEAGTTPPPPPVPSSNEETAKGGCWSPTLGVDVEELACVQSDSNEIWFQCQGGLWYSGVNGGEGRFGPCASIHPIQP